jgi:dihydrofolate synthase / folylpolyglutamate synthase
MNSLEWLESLNNRGWNLDLGRITDLLRKMGSPEKSLKCIHVGGSNGKGSVCAMLSSILIQEGYTVGLYTSPHLKTFNERIQINGKEITDEEVVGLVELIQPFVNEETYFEVLTAMAFQFFSEKSCDFVVLEVGLGGRFDATNVIIPLVSVITNISLEHTEYLGNSYEEIAFEKAGIIKEKVPVVTAAEGKALGVIKNIAKEKNSILYIVKPEIVHFTLGLKGTFQNLNAAIVIKAIKILREEGNKISEESLKKGLENAKWPGRFDFIQKNVLVDCAHNLGGITVLKEEVLRIKKNYEKIISVVGILKDKDKKTMVETLSSFSDYLIFTKPKTDRAEAPEELSKYTKNRYDIVYDVKNALRKARKISNPEDLIIVTGSIYTVGEII